MSATVKAAVIGLGVTGLPLAATIAATNATVVGVDVNPEIVAAVNAGRVFHEGDPGLLPLVRKQVSAHRLHASEEPDSIVDSDVVVVSVGTPIEPSSRDPSYKALKSALATIGPRLKQKVLVSIASTLAPGSMESVVRRTLERASKMKVGRDIHLVYCPERLPTVRMLAELAELPRILGANEPIAIRKALAFYRRFVRAEIHVTDWKTAEVSKTAENAYEDVQIAFANEIALISEELGVDAYRVRELVNVLPDRMMFSPRVGVGGRGIPRDPWLLVSPAIQMKPELIPTARSVNDFMPRRMARLVEEGLAASGRRIKGARVTVLGFAYPENTSDSRNTPAIAMIQELRRRGADVVIHDPFARSERGYTILRDLKAAIKGADCVALVTAHDEYRKLDLKVLRQIMRRRVIVDGQNFFRGPEIVKAGFVYRGIGKGQF
jgi:UDP-N-acetyl-D-mannosaminuronic acid dehydrogenase